MLNRTIYGFVPSVQNGHMFTVLHLQKCNYSVKYEWKHAGSGKPNARMTQASPFQNMDIQRGAEIKFECDQPRQQGPTTFVY